MCILNRSIHISFLFLVLLSCNSNSPTRNEQFRPPVPDHKTIAFISTADNPGWSLRVTNGDYKDSYEVSNGWHDHDPCWSIDKQYIFFTRRFDSSKTMIYKVKYDGTGMQRLSDPAYDCYMPRVSPDNNELVFSAIKNGRAEIFIMNLMTGRLTQITNQSTIDKNLGAKNYLYPNWFADGKRILFVYYLLDLWQQSIAIINRETGFVEKITCVDSLAPYMVRLSPTRDEIAFVGKSKTFGNEIYRINLDGSNLIRLTDSFWSGFPDWSADGEMITFTFKETMEKSDEIWVMNRNGGDKKRAIAIDKFPLEMSDW